MAINLFSKHQKPRNELSLIVHAKCEWGGAWHLDSIADAYKIASQWLVEGYDPNVEFLDGDWERLDWVPKPPAMPFAKIPVSSVRIHVRLVLTRLPGFWRRLRRHWRGESCYGVWQPEILAEKDLYLDLTQDDVGRRQDDVCAAREKLRDIGRMRALLAEYLQGEWAGPWDDQVQDGLAEIDRLVQSALDEDLGDDGKEA